MKIFDIFDTRYKEPFGAVKNDEIVTIRLAFESSVVVRAQLMICEIDKWDEFVSYEMSFEKEEEGYKWYAVKFSISKIAVHFFYFKLNLDGNETVLKKSQTFDYVFSENALFYQLTVYDKDFVTDDNFKGGIIYQIFPDRFYFGGKPKNMAWKDRLLRYDEWGQIPVYLPDENGAITNKDYFGGDIQGIIQKLDYLQSLSVTAIYLNPIFEAHSNHRYDTADYLKIDPLLGTEQDFIELCNEAKKRGIFIILDGVFSHTGSDSVYFNKHGRYDSRGAFNTADSSYYSWYQFKSYPHDYESWWGFDTLPTIDKSNKSFIEFICGENGVIHKWLSLGAYGFRLDVADELNDDILTKIREAVKKYGGGILIGEVWEDATTKVSYGRRRRYLLGDQLDATMNYPFRNAILEYVRYGCCGCFYNNVMQVVANYPQPALNALMNMLSTHDTERAITKLVGEEVGEKDRRWQYEMHNLSPEKYEYGKKLLKISAMLLYFLPGVPSIYYGAEAGLTGYKDPFNRCCFPWGREDLELVAYVTNLGKIRMTYPMLKNAQFNVKYIDHELCIIERFNETESFVIAVNRESNDKRLDEMIDFSCYTRVFSFGQFNNLILGGLSGVVLKKD